MLFTHRHLPRSHRLLYGMRLCTILSHVKCFTELLLVLRRQTTLISSLFCAVFTCLVVTGFVFPM